MFSPLKTCCASADASTGCPYLVILGQKLQSMCSRLRFQRYSVCTPNAGRQILRLLTGLSVLWTWPQVLHHSICVLASVAPVGGEAEMYYRLPDNPLSKCTAKAMNAGANLWPYCSQP